VENAKKPLSHASLIKAYVEGTYPYGEKAPVETIEDIAPPRNKKSRKKGNNIQLDLFND
jgi:hypothetical protein